MVMRDRINVFKTEVLSQQPTLVLASLRLAVSLSVRSKLMYFSKLKSFKAPSTAGEILLVHNLSRGPYLKPPGLWF